MQTHFPVSYQTVLKADVSKVWAALTQPELVKQYFFGTTLQSTWEVGSPIIFSGAWEGQAYKDKGTVLEYTHNKSLKYSYWSSWSNMPDLPENYLLISYAVEPHADGTLLTIIQTNYDEVRAQHSQDSWASIVAEMRKVVE